MKNIVHDKLSKIDGHLLSIQKDVDNDHYELEIGLRPSWVYKATSEIGCDTIHESENGNIIKVYPRSKEIVIDDLINFVEKIIHTNERIAEMEEQFQKQLDEQKKMLQEKIKAFQEELEKVKDISFDDDSDESNEDEFEQDETNDEVKNESPESNKPSKIQLTDKEKEILEEKLS